MPHASDRRNVDAAGKKTAEAVQHEVAQEVSRLLQLVFAGVRKIGQIDLEAVEMLVCGSMHRAGAEILNHLLSSLSPELRQTPCTCGHTAQYHDTRPKQLLTALGQYSSSGATTFARIAIRVKARATANWTCLA